jgi:hypothetical protein
MKRFSRAFALVAITFFTFSCSETLSVEEEVLQDALDTHGGLEAYHNFKDLSYLKTTYTTEANGSIRDTLEQRINHPRFNDTYLTYSKEGAVYEVSHLDNQLSLLQDSTPVNDSLIIEQHQSSVDGAKFVFFQPFKLKDEKAHLSYQGVRNLELSRGTFNVHHLEVTYKGSSDTWYFFIDTKSYQVVANAVKHNDKMSLITNDSMQWHQGLLVHHKRTSYLSNDAFESIHPQAFYDYEMIKE